MTLRKALLAATVLALPVAAQAQPVSGLYIGAGGGLNIHQDSNNNGVKTKFDDIGAVGLASIGWGFGNGLRAEIEGSFRSNDIRSLNGGGRTGNSGYFRNYAAMANVLYDFNLGLPVIPYLGVGVGYGWVDVDKANIAGPGGSRYRIEDVDGNLAYQGIAGMAFALPVPGLALTAEYRFFGTLEPKLNIDRTSVVGAPGGTYKPTNYNHSALIGIRYAFNTPVAPPPPAPVPPVTTAPEVARTYLVFFDWDRADLTDRARQIISEAAGAARRVSSTRIEVAGHADRSGTPQYNQRLSQRRADAVAAELVRQGVSRNEIAVTAFGESRPLVPTADGVREPQNRRVEIVLR
ncbi:OmpA family protein [Belnapia rosea]|uniref:Outer membrane protein beta-barrel domain-containing protein n=1 Tax=Belnapia rosea TaxID=938405 RepID=A0A1G7A2I6_9PROT|nr:OmpA family protein [Belnapia rosea]SDB69470.1 Outer membrane protein beta-barrel domain-containing protein [Belnapia rosea]SDE08823.1 Outer membrane protein beta-barrel domain-containing protein [Belnapia rosea]